LLIQSQLNSYYGYNNIIPSEYIQNIIQNKIQNTIDNIILYSEYGEKINDYNYTEAFNFAYYFLTLNLTILREDIKLMCIMDIKQSYEIENPLLIETNITETENSPDEI